MYVVECLCSRCLVMIHFAASDSNHVGCRCIRHPQASATEQKVVVVSVSPQSRASLAERFGLSSSEAGRRLTSFFKGLGECKCFFFFFWEVDLGWHGHFWRSLSWLQGFIMCSKPASVAPSACWRARESLWSVSKGRSRTARVCRCWHHPVQVFIQTPVFYPH